MSAAEFDKWAFEQRPALSRYCQRLSLVQFSGAASGSYIPYHSPVSTPWKPSGHRYNVEAVPEYAYEATSNVANDQTEPAALPDS